MNEDNMVPVYLVMGLLESGKSTFLEEILSGEEFQDGDTGVIISCEEGEVAISPASAAKCGMAQEYVEDESAFTAEYLKGIDEKYHPQRIFIEYNGMWDPDTVFSADLPANWEIYQVIMLIDASTFQVYLQNMRSIIGNMIKCSELLIFNRCSEELDLASFRRTVKAVNNQIQLMFEHKDGRMIELGKDIPPYDLSADPIEIADEDFGIWYMDAADDKDRYDGKRVHFRAKVMKGRKLPDGYFVPGRNAMTCCAADIRFIGFLCKSKYIDRLTHGQWIYVTAVIKYRRMREYGGVGPVLYAEHIASADKPAEDLVYFY
ncbi:MAG: GTPase [Lachnospiraceae bacterium]|nr:GTPase [Lachnospiraceae bacterium]